MREVHIANNFYDFIGELKNAEIKQVQKAIKQIQADIHSPSLRRHKLEKIKSPHVVSYSANQDIRIIALEPDNQNTYLLYVDHHDAAYNWAKTRRVDLDTATGVLKIVGIRAEEMSPPEEAARLQESRPSSPLEDLLPPRKKGTSYFFDAWKDSEILATGIPPLYLDAVRRAASDHDVMLLVDHVPTMAAEALFELAVLVTPGYAEDQPLPPIEGHGMVETAIPFRSFKTDSELQEWVDGLEKALNMPFEHWLTFLHPAQRKAVSLLSQGPVRVAGGAGTGKTVVGLHRALFLCQSQFEHVCLITFNRTLMNNLKVLAKGVFTGDQARKYRVDTFYGFVIQRLKETGHEVPEIDWAAESFLGSGLAAIRPSALGTEWRPELVSFIQREIVAVIAPQRIDSLAKYVKAPRRGTGRPLTLAQKEELWKVYEISWRDAKAKGRIPGYLLSHYALELSLPRLKGQGLVVDEVQDLYGADLAFLADQASGPNQLTLLEDSKQRIYGSGYSLKALGINVAGKRSVKLFVNYRTTEEIGLTASKTLVETEVNAFDLPRALRTGRQPIVKRFSNDAKEMKWVVEQIADCQKRALKRIAVVGRSHAALGEIESALLSQGISYTKFDRDTATLENDNVALCTMHSAKGLEFEAVFVIGLNYGRKGLGVPREFRDDETAAKDFERREKHLLYVALTRARDELYISGQGDILDIF